MQRKPGGKYLVYKPNRIPVKTAEIRLPACTELVLSVITCTREVLALSVAALTPS